MNEPLEVASWERATALARELGVGGKMRVPKDAEPSLPTGLDLRRSNTPWSVHRGALAVYRENVPGEHLQVREYRDHWLVELDRHNPHFRPARHVALDTRDYVSDVATDPVWSLVGLTLYTPVRSLQFAEEMASLAAETPKSFVSRGLEATRAVLGPGGADEDA